MVAASFGDFRTGFYGLRNPRGEFVAGSNRAARATELLESSALWHWLGRDWGGDGLLRHRAAIREDTETVRGQADRFAPTGAGKAGVDDHGNHQGAIAGAA